MEVMVALDHPDGTAAVYRDADGVWLTGQLGSGGTGLDDYAPAAEGLREGMVAGGLLPPGATGAEVVDAAGERRSPAIGEGAWVIVLAEAPGGDAPPVRFLDAAGRSVRPPLPDEWSRRFDLDGVAREFQFVAAGAAWAAVRRDGDLTITLTARDVDPDQVALARVPPELLG